MIVFHDGNHRELADYTGGRAWDNTQLLRHPMPGVNTEKQVTQLLATCSDKIKIDNVALSEYIKASQDSYQNVWIIKGLHQRQSALGGLAAYAHLTVSLNGIVYHLKFIKGNSGGWSYVEFTQSKKRHIKDLDGFSL